MFHAHHHDGVATQRCGADLASFSPFDEAFSKRVKLVLVFVLLLWTALGWAVLTSAGFDEPVELGLLSLVTGLALATFSVSTASLLGAPIATSCWFIVAVSISLVFVRLFVAWSAKSVRSLATALAIPSIVVALNVLVVGQGLLIFGPSWQGLVNSDGATNSLGAEYFIKFPFFARLDPVSVLNGLDYASVASSLYVESGHRFADVMLLGLSAALTSQHPDEIYMAHAMMVRVALILVCVGLVYVDRRRVMEAGVSVVALTVSSLGAYVYWNQLISQMGGIAFAALAMVLWVRVCKLEASRATRAGNVALLALVCAALFRYYPEIAPMLALAMFVSLALHGRTFLVGQWRVWLVSSTGTALLLLIFSNVSLPNSVSYIFKTLGVGTGASQQSNGLMDYAFTPEIFPLLFGFLGLREVVADPWATLLAALTASFLVFMAYALWVRRSKFNSLASLTVSVTVAFLILWSRGEEFGTFKAILFLQPFVLLIGIVVVASLFEKRQPWALGTLAACFLVLNLRVELTGAQKAVEDVHPISGIARVQLLNLLEKYSARATPTVFDLQSFLLQSYAVLRQKPGGVTFAVDPPLMGFQAPPTLSAIQSSTRPDWMSAMSEFKLKVNDSSQRGYGMATFGCGPAPVYGSKFLARAAQSDQVQTTVYAGGQLQPLNRQRESNSYFVERGPGLQSTDALLAQRESSLGGWVLSAGFARAFGGADTPISIYFGERDPMGKTSTMSAVGRYLLLEIAGGDRPLVRFRLRFTRSFFGPAGSTLPTVRVYGATSAVVGGHGAGALDITTEEVSPCVVQGRRYVMIDFGKDPQKFDMQAPFFYRLLGVPYSPDVRRSVGFLRDISIISDGESASGPPPAWTPKIGGSVEGFVGIYEDGWLSTDSRIDVRSGTGVTRAAFIIEVDPVLLAAGRTPPKLSLRDGIGALVASQQLMPGQNRVLVPVHAGALNTVRLSSDIVLPLPNDGRLITGRLVSIEME